MFWEVDKESYEEDVEELERETERLQETIMCQLKENIMEFWKDRDRKYAESANDRIQMFAGRMKREGIQVPVREFEMMMSLITKQQHTHYQPRGHSDVAGWISRFPVSQEGGDMICFI